MGRLVFAGRILLLLFMLPLMVSCSGRKEEGASAGRVAERARPDSLGLDFPVVPLHITDEAEEAGYTIIHFWDKMDFTDTLRIGNDRFMDNSFRNYLSVFPYASGSDMEQAVGILLKRAEASERAYLRVLDMAELFLTSPNSYMRDEEIYYLFLRTALNSGFLGEERMERIKGKIEDILKNRKGTMAADFRIDVRGGGETTLYRETAKSGLTLLLFYDPECQHCHEILELLRKMPALEMGVASGRLRVVAVYPFDDRKVRESGGGKLPLSWLDGCSPSGEIERREIYSLPAMPVIYLLSSDNTVLLKDAMLPQLEAYLSDSLGAGYE